MQREIAICSDEYCREIALLEDGRVSEYYTDFPGRERSAGNIYLSVVKDVFTGMNSAFVDIGLKKNAYLNCNEEGSITADDARVESLKGRVKKGMRLLVQILKEPLGNKGAKVTTCITLPGRYVVLTPFTQLVGISKQIEDENERQRLRELINAAKPQNMGAIARTAAADANDAAITEELAELEKLWESVLKDSSQVKKPTLIYEEGDMLTTCLRNFMSRPVSRITVQGSEAVKACAEYVKTCADMKVDTRVNDYELFNTMGISGEIQKAFARKVWLRHGGYLIIDSTEAMNVIDVNSGRYTGTEDFERTVLEVNIEAAREIARQLRLRDMGGMIIADFIDMDRPESRERLLSELREALKPEGTRVCVHGITHLGLVEMTRRRVRANNRTYMYESCSFCAGSGLLIRPEAAAARVYRKYMSVMLTFPALYVDFTLAPAVAQAVKTLGMDAKMPRATFTPREGMSTQECPYSLREG